MAKIIIKNSEISSSAGINIPGNLSIAGDTVIGDVFTDSLVVNAHTTFNEDISAEEIVISSSFKGDGSQLQNLTASNISNFTNDVRSKFSAGTNITISNGVISSTAGGGTAGGTNQTVQFNSGSTFSGSANLIYNYTTNTLSGTTAEFTTVTASNVLIHGTASLFASPQTAYVLYDSASDKVSVFPGLSVTGSITASGPTQLTTVSGTTAEFTNITGSTGNFIQLTSSNFYNSLTVGLGVAPTSNYRMIAKNASTNTANAIRVENTLNTIGMNIGINAANQGVLQADRDLLIGGGTNYGITANSSREIRFNAGTNGAALGTITFTNQYVTVAAVPYNSYNFVISGTVGSTTQGRLQFANLGTAAAPLITQISDTNTGIYFPDADTVAISTNGTERLRITGSGDITVENISGTTAQFTSITSSMGILAGTDSQFQINSAGNITKINNISYSFPPTAATTTSLLESDNLGNLNWSPNYVKGAASSLDNGIARFDGTTGKIIQDGSGITISDAGAFTRAGSMSFTATGTTSDINITAGDDLIISANDNTIVQGTNTTIEGTTTSKLATSNQKVETTTGAVNIDAADTGADINIKAADNITNTIGYKSQYKITDITAGDLSTVDYDKINNTVRILNPNGSAGSPSYSFQNAAGSGMSWNNTDGVLAFSHNSSNKFNIGGTAGTSLINGGPWIRWDAGGLNTPTYSFHGDTDTGIYSPALNSVSVVHGGRERRSVSGEITTTDATVRTIYTYTALPNTAYSIMYQCVARQSTGAVNSYIGNVRAKNVSGTVTAVMSLTSANEENTTPTIGVTTSGTNILFTVTGAASTTFKWFAWLEIISVS